MLGMNSNQRKRLQVCRVSADIRFMMTSARWVLMIFTAALVDSHGGQELASAVPANPCDDLWSLATLYKNVGNPVLQEFALQGRVHLQYAAGRSDQGGFSSGDLPDDARWGDIDVRRFFAGFKATLFQDLKINAQAVVNADWGPVYAGLYEVYGTWAVNDQCQIGLGKYEIKFGREYEISSKEIPTIERSLLLNQVAGSLLSGVWVSGKNVAGPWFYEAGVFASDVQEEFTEFQAGALFLAKAGCDLKTRTGLDRSTFALHWIHSTKPGEDGGKPYDDALALAGDFKDGKWGATVDLVHASGAGVPDVTGLSVISTFDLAKTLQLVGRCQLADSNGNDGLRLMNRYERLAPDVTDGGRGDAYQAAYLGANWFLCGHKLKLMTGLEYAHMHGESDGGDYDGFTWSGGLRFYF